MEIEQIFDFLLDKFEHLLYILIRRRLKNGNMHNGEEFFYQTNTIFLEILDVFQEKLGQYAGKRIAAWVY